MSDWQEGQIQYVQGSGKKPYELKFIGGVYSCSCPAWRNAGGPIDRRSCKHLKQLRGDAVEIARISGSATLAQIRQIGTTTGRVSSAAPNQSNAPRPATIGEAAQMNVFSPERLANCAHRAGTLEEDKDAILDQAEKRAGRKLRPDEKTKLFGPPVLLAHPFEDADVDPTGYFMSEKLDGVRAYWNGCDFVSRQGNVFHAPDWFKAGLPDHPLDGELWIGRRSFQQTISIVKSVDAGVRWRAVQYLVFDLPHLYGIPFEKRQEKLEEVCMSSSSKVLKIVYQSLCTGMDHLKSELDRLVALGAEGVMIRKPGSDYEIGRSWTILKVKPWKDAEATVTGYEKGKGRHKGRLGGLVVKLDSGIEFNIGTGLSDEDRRNPPKVGSRVTFRFMDTTDAGVPKGASFVAVRDYE